MEEARCVDDVHSTIELSKSPISSLIEHIPDEESALQRVPIPEEIVAQLYEFRPQFCSENLLARCSIGNQVVADA